PRSARRPHRLRGQPELRIPRCAGIPQASRKSLWVAQSHLRKTSARLDPAATAGFQQLSDAWQGSGAADVDDDEGNSSPLRRLLQQRLQYGLKDRNLMLDNHQLLCAFTSQL